jgi:hypothetical protein
MIGDVSRPYSQVIEGVAVISIAKFPWVWRQVFVERPCFSRVLLSATDKSSLESHIAPPSRIDVEEDKALSQTITGLFDRYEDAKLAVTELETAGVPHQDISIVANDKHEEHANAGDKANAAGEDAGKGAGMGAAVGGVGGLLAGIGLLAIPGLGPVVAAGWLVSTAVGALGGAAIGAAAGGLVGALTHAGVPEHDAHVYA